MVADVPQRSVLGRVSGSRRPGPTVVGGLVVFDCDGVLIDSERLNVAIDVEWITALGWPVTPEVVVDRHLGRSAADQLADIAAHLGRPVTQAEQQDWMRRYEAAYDRLESTPGVESALEALVAQGWSLCVASSTRHDPLRRNLEHCGLLRFFPEGTIFSAEDVVLGKPEPDLFLHAAVAMGFGPSACVVVEDSQHGVAAARAAGMRVVGYAGGITPARMLAGADVLVTDLTELPELVSRWGAAPAG